MDSKKGLSSIVVLVILISLVFVSFFLIFNVFLDTTEHSSEGISLESVSIDLEIKSAWINKSDNSSMEVTLERNYGEGNISSLVFILKEGDGNNYLFEYENPEYIVKRGETRKYSVNCSQIEPSLDCDNQPFKDIKFVEVTFETKSGKGTVTHEVRDKYGGEKRDFEDRDDRDVSPGGGGGSGNGGSNGGGCTPESSRETCGDWICGEKINNCGDMVDCGTCDSGFNCSNGICINESVNCTDYKGENYYIKDYAYNGSIFWDYCGEGNLIEYYCFYNGTDYLIKNETFDCQCDEGECVHEVIETPNTKDMSMYSEKKGFLVSDKNWKEVLPLVPVSTWTGNESCNQGYGTASGVCIYPTLIYHDDYLSYTRKSRKLGMKGSSGNYELEDNLLFWSDNNGLHIYNFTNEEDELIANAYYPDFAVKDNKVIWSDYDYSSGICDLYLYYLEDNTKEKIGSSGNYIRGISLNEDYVVWSEEVGQIEVEDGGYRMIYDLYLYNISSKNKVKIGEDLVSARDLHLTNDFAVWLEVIDDNYYLNVYNLSSNVLEKIEKPGYLWNINSFNNKIVWNDYRDGNRDIYFQNLSTNEEFQLSSSEDNEYYPDIFEEKVVWERDGNIIFYNLSINEERKLTENPKENFFRPKVSKDLIVFMNESYSFFNYDSEISETYEFSSFDADSIIHFIKQYSLNNLTIVGETSQELDNLLVAPELGAGLNESDIEKINSKEYLMNYWDNYTDIVYVSDNYSLALIASTYASLINAPLVVEGIESDKPENFVGKNVLCVGDSTPEIGFCDRRYSRRELMEEYVAKTKDNNGENKAILVNPLDNHNNKTIRIKVSEKFSPEKSANSTYETYSKVSLASPILASAKHELILTENSTNYSEIDSNIDDSFSDFFNLSFEGISCRAGDACSDGFVERTEEIHFLEDSIRFNLSLNLNPDIRARVDWNWDKKAVVNEENKIPVILENEGLEVAENVNASFYIRNTNQDNFELMDKVSLGEVEVGGEVTHNFSWNPAEQGYYGVKLVTECKDDVDLSNNNDTRFIEAKLPGPDVEGWINWDWDKKAVVNEENKIPIEVENEGLEVAENVNASLYVKNETQENFELVDTVSLGEVKVGGEVTHNFSWNPAEQGYYEMKLVTECKDDVDLSNNNYTIWVEARYPGPDLEAYFYFKETPKLGEDLKIGARVVNRGTEIAEDILIKFYDDGGVFNETSLSSLDSGEEKYVDLNYSISKGEHEIKMVANLTEDVDLSDNVYRKNVYIYSSISINFSITNSSGDFIYGTLGFAYEGDEPDSSVEIYGEEEIELTDRKTDIWVAAKNMLAWTSFTNSTLVKEMNIVSDYLNETRSFNDFTLYKIYANEVDWDYSNNGIVYFSLSNSPQIIDPGSLSVYSCEEWSFSGKECLSEWKDVGYEGLNYDEKEINILASPEVKADAFAVGESLKSAKKISKGQFSNKIEDLKKVFELMFEGEKIKKKIPVAEEERSYQVRVNGGIFNCSSDITNVKFYINEDFVSSSEIYCNDLSEFVYFDSSLYSPKFKYDFSSEEVNVTLKVSNASIYLSNNTRKRNVIEILDAESWRTIARCDNLSSSCVQNTKTLDFEYDSSEGDSSFGFDGLNSNKSYFVYVDLLGENMNNASIYLNETRIGEFEYVYSRKRTKSFKLPSGMINESIEIKIKPNFYESGSYSANVRLAEDFSDNYLTIMGAPNAIPYRKYMGLNGGYPNYRSLDHTEYADLNGDFMSDLSVGRIQGISISDVSSYLARDLFYDEIRSVTLASSGSGSSEGSSDSGGGSESDLGMSDYSENNKKNKIAFMIGNGEDDHNGAFNVLGRIIHNWAEVFNNTGYEVNCTVKNSSVVPLSERECFEYENKEGVWTSLMKNKESVYLGHHGSSSFAGIYSSDIPNLCGSLVSSDSCSTCASYDGDSFCNNMIREGALSHSGAVCVAWSGNKIYMNSLNEIYYENNSIGKSFAYSYDSSKWYWMTNLLGDPTFKVNPSYKLNEKLRFYY